MDRRPPFAQLPALISFGTGHLPGRNTEPMINRTICLIVLAWASAVKAEAPSEIALYRGAAPGSEKWDWQEKSVTTANGLPIVTDVVRPVLLHYPAEKGKSVGTAMVVAPGGGFRALMMTYEGTDSPRGSTRWASTPSS